MPNPRHKRLSCYRYNTFNRILRFFWDFCYDIYYLYVISFMEIVIMAILILFSILFYGIGSIISMSIMISLLGIKDLYYTNHIQWVLVILSALFSWFAITLESIFIIFCLIYILASRIYSKIKVHNILKNMNKK